MRNRTFFWLLPFVLLACNDSTSPDYDRSLGPANMQINSPDTVGGKNAATQATGSALPEQTVQSVQAGGTNAATPAVQGQQATVPPANVGKGMNPAHGQPGHRCDIAVGAPLNSPPGKTVQANPQTTIVPSSQPSVKTQPGMNPPHGQPGHRCDIAVGAPLNSKAPEPIKVSSTDPVKADVQPAKEVQEAEKPVDSTKGN